jgi:hypothetical protein
MLHDDYGLGKLFLLDFKSGTVPKCQAECNRRGARPDLTDLPMGSERTNVKSAAADEPAWSGGGGCAICVVLGALFFGEGPMGAIRL